MFLLSLGSQQWSGEKQEANGQFHAQIERKNNWNCIVNDGIQQPSLKSNITEHEFTCLRLKSVQRRKCCSQREAASWLETDEWTVMILGPVWSELTHSQVSEKFFQRVFPPSLQSGRILLTLFDSLFLPLCLSCWRCRAFFFFSLLFWGINNIPLDWFPGAQPHYGL